MPLNSIGNAQQHDIDITQHNGDGGGKSGKDSTHHVTATRRVTVQEDVPNNATEQGYAASEAF